MGHPEAKKITMKPLSRNKRRGYLAIFFIAFVIGTPLFILDAKGYRLNWSDVIEVSQTGGLYISTDQSGIEIYINNELVKKTSIVQKSIFVQDLKPGAYEIRASKKGLQSWNKTLKVFPEIVTDARSFLIKSNPEPIEIQQFFNPEDSISTSSSKKTSLKNSKNPEYDDINALFVVPVLKTTSTKLGTTSPDSKTLSDILVKNEAGKLHIFWVGETDSVPNYFCENIVCKSEIMIDATSRILSFDFFPGRNDLIILRLETGIYVSEIDDRSPQNIQNIVSGPGFDFKIKDGKKIYLKKGEKIYSVSP